MVLVFVLVLGSLWALVSPHSVSFPSSKELIPHVTLELDGFLEVVGFWRKHGWSWGCV
jgi:hypothetical protein